MSMYNGKWGNFYNLIPELSDLAFNTPAEILRRQGIRISKEINIIANNTTVNQNVLQLYGAVRVIEQYAIITEVTDITNMTNVYADIWDGTISYLLTKNDGVFSGLTVGSFFTKDSDSTQPYSIIKSDQGRILEKEQKEIGYPFILNQKNGVDTFVRFNFTTNTTLNFKMFVYFKYEKINSGYIKFI